MPKSQRALSQVPDVVESIPDDVINETVKTILALDASKKPIKYSDVISHLSFKPKRKQIDELWKKVKNNLKDLGMVINDVSSQNTKTFIVTKKESELEFMHKFLRREERAERTLLTLLLSYIFMKNGEATEVELLRYLSNLKIDDANGPHDYFGNVKKKLTGQFVEQLYLTRTVVPGPEVAIFRWGPRATFEVSATSILEFVCKVGYGSRMNPKNWVSQYEKVNNENVCEDDNNDDEDDDEEMVE